MSEKAKFSFASKTPSPAPVAPKRRRVFRVLTDLSYGPLNTPLTAGEVTSDIPAESIGWLLEQKLIAVVEQDQGGGE